MDGIPVFLMEAGAFGVPVVTSPISGIPELVTDGETGWLVDPDDRMGLAATVVKLLTGPAERRRTGEALRERVKNEFSLDVQLDRLEEAWRSILEGSTSPDTST